MSKRPKRKNVRQGDFRVVVRGAHRHKKDYSRLMQATLDHFQTLRKPSTGAMPPDQRSIDRKEQP